MTSVRIYFSLIKIQFKRSSIKVTKKSVRLDIAKYSFSNSVVNKWNNLSKEVIASKSLAGFKKLHFHLCNNGIYISFELLSVYRLV